MTKANTWVETIEVRTYETDFQNLWKPAAFFRAMEEGAVHNAAHLGFDYYTLQKNHIAWVISRSKVKFLQFPKAGDVIHLHTWPKTIQQKIFFMRDYIMTTEDDQTELARATTAWLLIDTDKRRFAKPDALPGKFPENPEKFALDETLEKIPAHPNLREMRTFSADYSTVDLMGHVNNTHYIDWIFDCFSFDQIRGKQLDWLQINYSSEVKPHEEVKLSIGNNQGQTYTVEGYNLTSQTIAFEAQFGLKEGEGS